MKIHEFRAALTHENCSGALLGALRKLTDHSSLQTLLADEPAGTSDDGWGEWSDVFGGGGTPSLTNA